MYFSFFGSLDRPCLLSRISHCQRCRCRHAHPARVLANLGGTSRSLSRVFGICPQEIRRRRIRRSPHPRQTKLHPFGSRSLLRQGENCALYRQTVRRKGATASSESLVESLPHHPTGSRWRRSAAHRARTGIRAPASPDRSFFRLASPSRSDGTASHGEISNCSQHMLRSLSPGGRRSL